MNCLCWICLTLYIILGGIDSYASEHQKKRFFKPFLMPLLIVFLYLEHTENIWLLSGLTAGWLGDVLLIHKTSLRVKAGTVFFLSGHLFYAVYFLKMVQRISITVLLAAALAYIITGVLLQKCIMYGQPFKMRLISVIYMCAIGFMSFSAFLAAVHSVHYGIWISWSGTIFFIVSDSFILDQSVHHKPQKHVMPAYLMAQLLIVSGSIV